MNENVASTPNTTTAESTPYGIKVIPVTSIKSIKVVVNGKEIELSEEEARALRDELTRLFPGTGWVPSVPYTPWYPPAPQWPPYNPWTTYCNCHN